MTIRQIEEEYFNWLYDIVCTDRYSKQISYKKLLMYLHDTEFRYLLFKDGARAEDGISLRYRFACDRPDIIDADLYLEGPCSVLEMMIALALRCEENIMDDPLIGNRTAQWFWGMVTNLGLGAMYDSRFDIDRVEEAVTRLLERKYKRDGRGGLFTVRDCSVDLRDIEIWIQLCWYLDSIT